MAKAKPKPVTDPTPAAPKQPVDPLRADFRNFLFLIWKHLNLIQPTARQYEIAQYLQHGPDKANPGLARRIMVRGFRGVAKSWITYAFVCWLLYCDPQLNILVISASKAKADEFANFVKRLVTEVPILQHLIPRQDQRWASVSFDVGPAEADPNPSVKSAGITGQITGSRADVIIADDVETPDNALTQMMREKLAEKIKEFDSILKPLPTARIIYLGTPQTDQSIYDQLPERGFNVRVWPARYPDAKLLAKYGSKLSPGLAKELEANPSLVGHSTDSRFTDMDLAEREASIGRSMFQLQFMLDTSAADGDRYPLKLRDLVVTPLDLEMGPEKVVWAATPEWCLNDIPNVGIPPDRLYRPVPLPGINYLPYTGSVLVVDPAGRGQDETSYAVVNTVNGFLFLMDAGGFPPGFGYHDDTLASLAKLAARYKVKRVLIEANFGDGMFTKLLTPHLSRIYPCTIEEVKHSTQKERRICDTLEPVLNSHRLIVNASLFDQDLRSTTQYRTEYQHHYQLFFQLTRITRDKGALAHDDRLDALAIAVAYFADTMAQDTDKRVDAARNEAMKKELERFMRNAIGGPRKAPPVYACRSRRDFE